MNKISEFINRYIPQILINFFIYAIIGVLGAITDLGVFTLLFNYLQTHYLLAFLIGKTLGIIQNFILNSIFNFKVKDNLLKRFISFYLIGLTGISIGILLMYIFVDIKDFNPTISNIIITFCIAVIQYLINRFTTFKR